MIWLTSTVAIRRKVLGGNTADMSETTNKEPFIDLNHNDKVSYRKHISLVRQHSPQKISQAMGPWSMTL